MRHQICYFLLSLLVACGGGGSDVAEQPAPAPATPAAVFDDATSLQAAAYANVFVGTLSRVLNYTHQYQQIQSIYTPGVVPDCCGALTQTIADLDASKTLTPGDRYVYVYGKTGGLELGPGTVTVNVTQVGGAGVRAVIGGDFVLENLAGQIFDVFYKTEPSISGRVIVRPSDRAPLTVTAPDGLTLTVQPGNKRVQLTNLNLEVANPARNTIAGTVDMTFLSGALQGRLVTLTIEPGTFTTVRLVGSSIPVLGGSVVVTGANSAKARLTGASDNYRLQRDLNGDGTYESSVLLPDTVPFAAL